MTMTDLAVFYDPGNWTRLFWAYGSSYTIVPGRHIGTDITTYGQAKPIPALLSGPIVDWVDTSNLGRIYIQDVSESGSVHKYLSYCHASRYDAPNVGTYLRQGDLFGRIATGPKSVGFGHPNYPGSAWTGAHLHLVWHNKVKGAYSLGQNDTYGNPEHLIRNVLSTPAGLPTKPFPGTTTPTPAKEDDEMYSVRVNGNIYGVGEEFISHYANAHQATITRQVTSATDELHDLGNGDAGVANFGALLDGLGIPRGALDNQGRVLNPQSGKHEAGGVWSRRREAVAKLDQLLKR